MGGPLGKTKKITERGVEDVSNEMGAFMVVRAEFARGGRQVVREASAFHDLSRRSRWRSCRFCRYRAVDRRPTSVQPIQAQEKRSCPTPFACTAFWQPGQRKSIARSLRRTRSRGGPAGRHSDRGLLSRLAGVLARTWQGSSSPKSVNSTSAISLQPPAWGGAERVTPLEGCLPVLLELHSRLLQGRLRRGRLR